MDIKKVDAWQTSDGSVYGEKEEAEKREEEIKKDKIVIDFMKENYFPGMTESDFGDALEEFYDLIIKK